MLDAFLNSIVPGMNKPYYYLKLDDSFRDMISILEEIEEIMFGEKFSYLTGDFSDLSMNTILIKAVVRENWEKVKQMCNYKAENYLIFIEKFFLIYKLC